MSCFFSIAGQDVWNPSNLVARLFLGTMDTLSQLYERDPGIGEIIDDECEIDGQRFNDFISFLVTEHDRSHNPTLQALLCGSLSVGLVLLERAGYPARSTWQEHCATMSQGMPR